MADQPLEGYGCSIFGRAAGLHTWLKEGGQRASREEVPPVCD
jgi:hypothetical protein